MFHQTVQSCYSYLSVSSLSATFLKHLFSIFWRIISIRVIERRSENLKVVKDEMNKIPTTSHIDFTIITRTIVSERFISRLRSGINYLLIGHSVSQSLSPSAYQCIPVSLLDFFQLSGSLSISCLSVSLSEYVCLLSVYLNANQFVISNPKFVPLATEDQVFLCRYCGNSTSEPLRNRIPTDPYVYSYLASSLSLIDCTWSKVKSQDIVFCLFTSWLTTSSFVSLSLLVFNTKSG